MPAPIKVKVKVDLLLGKLYDRMEEINTNYAERRAQYKKDAPAYVSEVLSKLDALRAQIEVHGIDAIKGNYRGLCIETKKDFPTKPSVSTSELERFIKTLEMSSEDSVVLSAEDARKYLG